MKSVAVVLAGGKGVRMLPLTRDRPKAMVIFNNKPLLEWILLELSKACIKKVILVVGYKKEKIIEYFGKSFANVSIDYVVQEKPLGTGHALLQAKQAIAKHSAKQFLVCYGDVIASCKELKKIMEAKQENVIALRYEERPERFGVVEVKNGKVMNIVEKPKRIEKPALINAGLYKLSQDVFTIIEKLEPSERGEIELTDALKKLIENGKLAYVIVEDVLDIGTINDLVRLSKTKAKFLF